VVLHLSPQIAGVFINETKQQPGTQKQEAQTSTTFNNWQSNKRKNAEGLTSLTSAVFTPCHNYHRLEMTTCDTFGSCSHPRTGNFLFLWQHY